MLFLILYISEASAQAQSRNISGRIVDAKKQTAIPGAIINVDNTFLWAVSDRNGHFSIRGVPGGKQTLQASFLGYVTATIQLDASGDVNGITVGLIERTLAIDEVVVTAQAADANLNTTLTIGSNALEHMQISNVADVAALLPGGKTVNPDLTTNPVFSLRSGGSTAANAAFGTAVEVDGVRMGNNASFGAMGGIGTRSIAVGDIESVEVLTGVPSAEYGDLNSGVVQIHTRKGRTPLNVLLSVNPRTQQTSFSKGFDLGANKGVFNLSGEWAKATQQLSSPYTSYTRRGFSLGYGNTFRDVLKLQVGVTGNIGGMNTKDDPDAYTEEYIRERDHVFRANTSLAWLLNKSWITNLKFDASVSLRDNRSFAHMYYSYGSEQPAVHADREGYFMADKLPYTFFADQIIDSKELNFAAALKYEWSSRWGSIRNNVKAGVQWKANGNVGEGEYYLDPALAPNGYRPRPYSSYPFMHNLALYAEDNFSFPIGLTTLSVMAGARFERVFIHGTRYENLNTLSPRFNARWRLSDGISVRGGWGVTEKLPSYYVLYPRQEYRDIQTFGFSYNNNESSYIYHTQPYALRHNASLKWQRNHNAEAGLDLYFGGVKVSLVGYINRTKQPYKYASDYAPFSYDILRRPDGFTMPAQPEVKVDNQTGMVYMRDASDVYWTPMDVLVSDQTFVKSTWPDNGADMTRKGIELIVDFPEIKPLSTQIRLDAAYGYTKYVDSSPSCYYNTGWSHSDAENYPNRSYQYVGIYANGGGSSSVVNGRRTQSLDANITAITHIPRARLIVSCRLEMSLVKRTQNLSVYGGRSYAFTVEEAGATDTGGNIYDGNSYTAVWPVAYVGLDGAVRPFTKTEAADPLFSSLLLKSGNAYTFAGDGYDPYFSANLSVTKEIGDHVSLSFFANNFTRAPRYKRSYATGIDAVIAAIPEFYYGITCRIKL